jgi:hypothetical protein
MPRQDEQKALAGFCCFKAVTILFTAGHRATAGEVVAAGMGFAPAKASRERTMSDSMMNASFRKPAMSKDSTKGKRISDRTH